MTLLCMFLLGTLLAFVLGRYNESWKVFIFLFLSLMFGCAIKAIVNNVNDRNEQSNVDLTQVCPTQELPVCKSAAALFQITDEAATVKVTALNPVGQVYTPEKSEIDVTLSKVFGRTRDQPRKRILDPPESVITEVNSS